MEAGLTDGWKVLLYFVYLKYIACIIERIEGIERIERMDADFQLPPTLT